MTLTIKHYDGINRTPALPLLKEADVALYREGFVDNCIFTGWDSQALVAFVAGEPVGVLLYDKADWQKAWIVKTGYVKADHRRGGVYNALWKHLVGMAQNAKVVSIQGGTRLDNKVMRAVAKAQGRYETTVILMFDVPPASEVHLDATGRPFDLAEREAKKAAARPPQTPDPD